MKNTYLLALLIAGCASANGAWERAGATDQDFRMARGECNAMKESAAGAGPLRRDRIFSGCMEGKGWNWAEH